MIIKSKKVLLSLFLLLFTMYSYSQNLEDAEVCSSVKNLEPVNPTSEFNVGQKVYCWIKLTDATIGSSIKVEWYSNDQLQYTSKLSTNYSSMRTYTYKTVGVEGNWRADIKKSSGELLRSLEFVVGHGYSNSPTNSNTTNSGKVAKDLYYKPLSKDIYILKNPINKKIVFVDKNKTTIAEADYINEFVNGYAKVENYRNKTETYRAAIVNKNGKLITNLDYYDVGEYSEGLIPVAINEKEWGYIDTTGKMIIKPKYDLAYRFSNGLAKVCLDVGKQNYAFINKSGKTVISDLPGNPKDFNNGVAIIEKKIGGCYKKGLINEKGKLIADIKYDQIGQMQNGFSLAYINDNKKKLYVNYILNDKGKEVKEFVDADRVDRLDDFIIVNVKNGKTEIYNGEGKQIKKYETITYFDNFSEDLALMKTKDYCFFINKDGEKAFAGEFKNGKSFSNGLAAVQDKNNKWGFIDNTGKYVIDPNFGNVESFIKERAIISENGKYGFIDKKGNILLKPQFDFIEPFWSDISVVENNNKYGYIDINGNIIIKPKFQEAYGFVNDIAIVKTNNKCGMIYKDGSYIFPAQFDGLTCFEDGLAMVGTPCADQTVDYLCYWYYMDMNGDVFWKPENNISDFEAILVLPPDYDPKKKYPVLVTYPCTGGDGYWLIGAEYKNGKPSYEKPFADYLTMLYPDAKERKEKSFILLMPGGRGSEADHSWQGFSMCINRYDRHVKSNLRTYSKQYSIDTTQVYAAGYSLGGDLSWALNIKNPEMYKGAVIMGSRCSYPDKGSLAILKKKNAKFYMAMGEYEDDVRIKGNYYAQSLLKKHAIPFQYYIIPKAGHDDLPSDKLIEALRFIMSD